MGVGERQRSPEVSVVMPTFNRASLVVEAIESVLEQSFHDFELIVVDDGSTDGTERALARFAGRLRYERQEHRGVSTARNAGLRLARGAIVASLDSDNLWLPGHLAAVAAVLRDRPSAVLVSTCQGFVTAGSASDDEAVLIDPLPRLLAANFVGTPSCIAVRREALLAIGGFDEELEVASDADAWLRLALHGPFAFLRRRTVVVRRSPDSLFARGRREGLYLDSWERIAARMTAELASSARHELVDRARGSAHLAAALRAIDRGDDAAVRGELASACRLFPELSQEPGLVSGRLRTNLPGSDRPPERFHQLATAARAWPDRASDTAVALRAQAVAAAVRAGRPAAAARLAAGLQPRASWSLARRALPLVRSSFARRRSVSRARP
jgi:hypothetical protein